MSNLTDLAERCEKATGPDRTLDDAILRALNGGKLPMRPVEGIPNAKTTYHPEFTASLDAAMTLIREPFFFARLDYTDEWQCRVGERGEDWKCIATTSTGAATPALALCAAALRARAQ